MIINNLVSSFVAVMRKGRECLIKMMKEGNILPEDCAILNEDTKAWLGDEHKQDTYAQNCMEKRIN
jgi:hypothetical protein